MLYRPKTGKLWDPTVLRWQGQFYLFTMYYEKGAPESYACRLATSRDGVHWTDRGNVLTDDRPVWKCGVSYMGGRFYMNYGSMTGSTNDTMGYAVSDDLLHWEKLGYDHPDPRWYEAPERWDHMYCRESDRGGYVGYIVATPKPGIDSLCGLRRSENGRDWESFPPPIMDWAGMEHTREMEVGGCEKLGGRWYLMGGICPPFNGNYGYAAYVFESEREEGPFRLCRRSRLAGHNGVPGEIFVSCLPGFVHDLDDPNAPLLASNAVVYQLDDPQNTCWATLFTKITPTEDGLFADWWAGNEALRGEPLSCPETVSCESRALNAYQLTDEYADRTLLAFDPSDGLILEGTLTASPNPERGAVRANVWRPSAVGFELNGTAILTELGHPKTSYARVGDWNEDGFAPYDTVSPWDAARNYITPGEPTRFRLLLLYGVAQLYLNDRMVQTFTCKSLPHSVRLCAKNARVTLEAMTAHKMSL